MATAHAGRMSRIGVAVRKLAGLLHQYIGDPVADKHAAKRQVPGRDALGERHEIGPRTEVVRTEPLAETTEAGDDFIGDQQNAVLVANALHFGPVGIGRNDDAAGALDRLADERRNLVRRRLP